MSVAGPHLLAVDDDPVAFEHSPGAQGGKVAARVRLGERLRPGFFAGQEPREEALGQRGRIPVQGGSDHLNRQVGVGKFEPGAAQFVVVGGTVPRAPSETAERLRPSEPLPPGRPQRAGQRETVGDVVLVRRRTACQLGPVCLEPATETSAEVIDVCREQVRRRHRRHGLAGFTALRSTCSVPIGFPTWVYMSAVARA